MKSVFAKILVLVITTMTSHAQKNATFEGTLTYEILLDGHPLTDSLHNTVMLYQHYAFEDSYKFIFEKHVSVDPMYLTQSVTKQATQQYLEGFILTDFKNRHYTKFDSVGLNPVKETSPTLRAKTGLDFFQKWRELEWNIDAYEFVKDTVMNNHSCKLYQNLTSDDESFMKRNRINVYIDPHQKPAAFQLCSKLESVLDGTIIQFDEFYANGSTNSVRMKYYEGLTPSQIETVEKLIAQANGK